MESGYFDLKNNMLIKMALTHYFSPNYINYYLHLNDIHNFSKYKLEFTDSNFKITQWAYSIACPTIKILKKYKLNDVLQYAEAIQNASILNTNTIPFRLTSSEQSSLENSKLPLNNGIIIYNTDTKKLYCWIDSSWKKLPL
jgi:hypothetical protein